MRTFIILLCILSGVGCAQSTKSLAPVDGFDLERYTGLWYEVARFPHRFERGLVAVTAEYTIQEDGSVSVTNRGFDVGRQQWNEADLCRLCYQTWKPRVASGRGHYTAALD